MVNYWSGHDDELDAALILSGTVDHPPEGRYCFQTTYMNECYEEYYQHSNGYRLIWVHRNPYSVVFSLLHNWRRFALNELFRGCGVKQLSADEQAVYKRFGIWGFSRLYRACQSYNGKVSQVLQLSKKMGPDSLMIVDYDDLVRRKRDFLPKIYEYIGLPYKDTYADLIHEKSIEKADRLSRREKRMIGEFCVPVDTRVRSILTPI